jgi:hypothetical protein
MMDECKIYAMDNLEVAPRVDAFIRAIHNWHEKVQEYASKNRTAAFSLAGTGTACFVAIGAGLNAAGRMAQQAPPTPEWLVSLGIFTFVVSAGGCVIAGAKSVFDSLALSGIIEAEQKWQKDALDNWVILQSCQGCEE